MRRMRHVAPALTLGCAVLLAACRTLPAPVLVQPGAPDAPPRAIAAAEAASLPGVGHTEADVRFMQAMAHHHAQALEMTALAAARTDNADLRRLARRIELSQADEIAMIRAWLEHRGAASPADHAHHGDGAPMPGMLSASDMTRLAAAKGPAFDRLFLELMIRHHEGALEMVGELLSAERSAQEPEVFAFASDVEADQRIEIARMRRMLLAAREPRTRGPVGR